MWVKRADLRNTKRAAAFWSVMATLCAWVPIASCPRNPPAVRHWRQLAKRTLGCPRKSCCLPFSDSMFSFRRLRESLDKLRGPQLDERVGDAMSAPQQAPPDVVAKARKELQADVQKCVTRP